MKGLPRPQSVLSGPAASILENEKTLGTSQSAGDDPPLLKCSWGGGGAGGGVG